MYVLTRGVDGRCILHLALATLLGNINMVNTSGNIVCEFFFCQSLE